MDPRAALQAAFGALAAVAMLGGPAAAQDIEREGQRVEVHVTSHPGSSTTVCLESAPPVQGRKRLTVSYGAGAVRLSTSARDRGPHCASFEPAGPRFRVRLEYGHLVVLTAILADRDFARDEYRGKTITFRWVRE
ncbi:MAG TPA: hypothetical protein VGR37_06755 [Longimicrobiaceae bacterium]|nr:hypothetical protein [Longimicrobiaceae bacterium]